MVTLILIPSLLYLALYFLFSLKKWPQRWLGVSSLCAAAAVALITSLGLLYILRFKTDWSERTQVEWTGFEVVGQPLIVGGSRDQAAIGWPNEAFSPVLKV